MVKFQLIFNNVDSGWVEGGAGACSLQGLLAEHPAEIAVCQLNLRQELTDDQAKNFVALLSKCWYLMNLGVPAPVNPWAVGIVATSALSTNLTTNLEEHFWSMTLTCHPRAAASVLLRLVNMMTWTVRYTDRIKLKSSTPLKRTTYAEISKYARPGIPMPDPAPAHGESDSCEDDQGQGV